MDRFQSSKPFALAFAMALITVFALNGAALADTLWSDTAPASVTDLLNADNWDNGTPTTAGNPGFITGKTITVSNDFYPGANGQDIDITFNGATSTTFSKGFVPLKNLPNGNTATFTMRLQDTANVYVTNNFWGGNNNTGQSYDQSGKDYLIYQYYGGDSTFSCNEWWTAMTARTYIEISDNATVTARGGTNSGLGWDNAAPYTADGSRLEMSGKGALNVSSTNLNFWGEGTTVNMRGSSSISAKAISISRDAPQVNLYDNAKITASEAVNVANQATVSLNDNANITLSKTLKLDNKSSLTLNNNASLTVTSDCALDRNGRMDVNGNANVAFKAALKIGDINAGDAGGAVFNLSGGTVTVTGTTYFSYHSDATVNISGGKFIANGNQLYATDQKGKTVDINMTNDGYLQAKDLRLSQHGNTNLTMSDTSQIKVENLNMAFNYASGDNVVNVVTMGGSSNITATSNMYFFGNNVGGAAYGSLTLNDNASVAIANEVQVGKGAATSLIDGKSYAAEITLNGNSKFTTTTFTTNSGATSATTVNGLATFKADTININGDSEFNVNGGTVNALSLTNTEMSVTSVSGTGALNAETINIEGDSTFNISGGAVNVTSLNNAGTVNLENGGIYLAPYGLITSTNGTFNATGGTINLSESPKATYSNGDQMLAGLFRSQDEAEAAKVLTVAPSNWETAVVTINNQPAVVAGYNSTPTADDIKYWDPSIAGWAGNVNNNTGYVFDGENGSIAPYSKETIVIGGTNTFGSELPADNTLVIYDGSSTITPENMHGNIFVNGGTVTLSATNSDVAQVYHGYVEINGGSVTRDNSTSKWWIKTDNGEIVVNEGTLNIQNGTGDRGLAMLHNSAFTNNGGNVTIGGKLLISDSSGNATTYYTSTFTNNSGTTILSKEVDVPNGAYAHGYLNVNGGSVVASDVIYVAQGAHTKGYLNITGNGSLQTKDLHIGYKGNAELVISNNASLKVDGSTFHLAYNLANGDNVAANVTMSGNSRLDAAQFRVFQGNNDKDHKGAGYASFTMTDNAYVYVSGNMWGGSNDDNSAHVVGLLGDNTYNLEMTFSDNSYFSSNEFWVAMTAKSHVVIEDNATVYARGGYSGIGWAANAAGSLVEIKGGTFKVDSTWFAIGCRNETTTTGVCNVVQTGGEATYKMLLLGNNASAYDLSGDDSIMTANSVKSLAGSSLKIKGGTANLGTVTNGGTLDVSGGTANAGTITNTGTVAVSGGTLNFDGISIANNGIINISGGMVIPGAGGITAAGAHTVNLSGGVFTTNDVNWAATDITATLADNSEIEFAPQAGQSIQWTGALVNNAQNASVVKNGLGSLKIDSPEANPSKAKSFLINMGELDFNGYLTSDIEVNSGATFSPGNSIGKTFETGDFYLNDGGTLLMEIGGSSVDENDQLIINGNLYLEGGIINLALAENSGLGPNDPIAIKLTSTNSENIIDDVLNAISSYYFTGLSYSLSADGSYYQITGVLDANAVPEPSTWALLVLGVVALFLRKRVRN